MEAAAGPSSQRQRTTSGGSGSGGSGGASMADLPDVLLGHIFESIGWSQRASVVLVSRRWHRVLHETPSIWRVYELSAPADLLESGASWSVAEQEEWLQAKLRQLRRVSPAVESLTVEHTAGADVLADVLLSVAASQRLTRIAAGGYEEPLSVTAVRALTSLTGLEELVIGSLYFMLPANFSWAVAKLTTLCSLSLEANYISADLPAVLARLPRLTALVVSSAEALPDMQMLTALGQLRELELAEVTADWRGLAVLPTSAFPDLTRASYRSPLLTVGNLHLEATEEQASCVFSRYGAYFTLKGMQLTAGGAVQAIACALKPAGMAVTLLQLSSCAISAAAWHPEASDLGGLTELEVDYCLGPGPGGSPAAALHAALQQMRGLRELHLTNCNLSSGVPGALCQLSGLTHLSLRGTQLSSLPPLACMPVLSSLNLDFNQFTRLPPLGSAPSLKHFDISHNPSLVLDAASVDRLAAEAPNLRQLNIGGPASAGARLARMLLDLAVL